MNNKTIVNFKHNNPTCNLALLNLIVLFVKFRCTVPQKANENDITHLQKPSVLTTLKAFTGFFKLTAKNLLLRDSF